MTLCYLMALHKMCFHSSLGLLEAARGCACPNTGFREQLVLYEGVRFAADPDLVLGNVLYRSVLIQRQDDGPSGRNAM